MYIYIYIYSNNIYYYIGQIYYVFVLISSLENITDYRQNRLATKKKKKNLKFTDNRHADPPIQTLIFISTLIAVAQSKMDFNKQLLEEARG